MTTSTPARPRPFPARLSLHLDRIVAQLDRPGLTPAACRWLRLQKRAIERLAGVPVKGGRS